MKERTSNQESFRQKISILTLMRRKPRMAVTSMGNKKIMSLLVTMSNLIMK